MPDFACFWSNAGPQRNGIIIYWMTVLFFHLQTTDIRLTITFSVAISTLPAYFSFFLYICIAPWSLAWAMIVVDASDLDLFVAFLFRFLFRAWKGLMGI